MKITTRGQPKKIKRNICKKAALWYANRLISEKKLNNKIIKIIFEENLLKNTGMLGECADDEEEKNVFYIYLDSSLSIKETLLSLAHEMCHVKQFINGELKNLRGPFCKWYGTKLNYEEIDYWDHPWEIDAHGREKGLYFRFKESLKKEKK